MAGSPSQQERKIFSRIYPLLGLLLVFLGPYFFFQGLSFLRIIDYTAAVLCFVAGWSLLRAGVDITRAVLAALSEPPSQDPSIPPERSQTSQPHLPGQ